MALPERKKRDQAMPPPGPPKTVIAIGIGPKKPGTPDGLPDEPKPPKGRDEEMPPEALTPPPAAMGGAGGDEEGEGDEEKCSPERAIVIRANEHCRDCKNYEPTTGECHEVEGVFEPDDACFSYFEAMHDEPDADDTGGPSDMDADNAKMGALTQ